MIKNSLHSIQPEISKLFGMFRGVVESNDSDPSQSGRIKVRIFGIHSPKISLSEDGTEGIPTKELPWAEPALGLFEGSVSGFGAWTIPLQGSHVFVFFENGNPMKPIYFASAPGITSTAPNTSEGFNDPDGEFPTLDRMGEPDFHRLSRGKNENTIVTYKNDNLDENILKADDTEWSEPESAFKAKYPNNAVIVSHSGLTVEMDSTPGEERFHIYHPSNTYIEIDSNGNMIVRNELNKFQIIKGESNTHIILDNNITIDGNRTKLVKKEETMEVRSDQNETIDGSVKKEVGTNNHETVNGNGTILIEGNSNISINKAKYIWCGGNYNLSASTINLNSGTAYKKVPLKPKE